MEKDFNSANREQGSTDSGTEWDTLKDVPNAMFNPTEIVDDLDAPERIERRLKGNLIDCNERFIRGERIACGSLADELSRSHLRELSTPVQEFGEISSRLDSSRFDILMEYLDKKFSSELSDEEKDRVTSDLRDEYLRGTMQRANLTEEETSNVRRMLARTEDERLARSIHHIDRLRKESPNYQVQVANAYFDYFDNPSDNNRTRLTTKVLDYTDTLRREFRGVTEGAIEGRVGSRDLPDSIYFNFARNTTKNYEEMHEAILDYYDFRAKNSDNKVNVATPEINYETPDVASDNPQHDASRDTDQTQSRLRTDIF